jgi:hypothetical protein
MAFDSFVYPAGGNIAASALGGLIRVTLDTSEYPTGAHVNYPHYQIRVYAVATTAGAGVPIIDEYVTYSGQSEITLSTAASAGYTYEVIAQFLDTRVQSSGLGIPSLGQASTPAYVLIL